MYQALYNKFVLSRFFLALSLVALSAISFTSCIRKNFDAPPDQNGIDPKLNVNMTLAQLQGMVLPPNSGLGGFITSDSIVSGVVCLDDRTGNLYKEIIIQDSTGGMELLLDRTYLYNYYPVGRKVYVKLKGLYIGTYHGGPVLGYQLSPTGSVLAIPSTLIENYIVGANTGNSVVPIDVTLDQLVPNTIPAPIYFNRLVRISSAQFKKTDTGQVYALPGTLTSSTSRYIETCTSAQDLQVHNYGYSNFQAALTPAGNGTITGVFQTYNNAGELIIEDTTGVNMRGSRCPTIVNHLTGIDSISIDSLHKLGAGISTGQGIAID